MKFKKDPKTACIRKRTFRKGDTPLKLKEFMTFNTIRVIEINTLQHEASTPCLLKTRSPFAIGPKKVSGKNPVAHKTAQNGLIARKTLFMAIDGF